MKILVVEDEFIMAEQIMEILCEHDFDVVGRASDVPTARQLARETEPDIVLCDICINEEYDGIELAHDLQQERRTAVIFLSTFDDAEHLQRAARVEPAAYVVKPFEARTLVATIKLAFNRLDVQRESLQEEESIFSRDRIFIKEGSRFIKLLIKDIAYVEAVGSYCDVYTPSKKITLSLNLKQFMSRLGHPKFARVHRSYLVNLDAIEAFDVNTIYIGEREIPISASQKESFMRSVCIF